MIKFTFDILKVIRETKNFSKNKIINKICRYDSNLFLHQSEIFAKLNGNKNRISEISKKGICVPTSIYNSFPILFCYSKDNYIKYIESIISENKKLFNIPTVIKTIDEKRLLRLINNIDESFNIFVNNIKNEKPVVITYQYQPKFWHNIVPHSVSLFGINNGKIIYFDSGEDVLFKSLSFYIRNQLTMCGKITKENELYELIATTDENRFYTLCANLLDYEYNENTKLSAIDLNYLTDKNIFYDSQSIIEYAGTNFSEYFDDNIYGNINFSFDN